MSDLNIYQRISEVRKKINYIQKDKDVSTGGGSYKATTHDQVTGMVRAHLIDAGIVIEPTLVEGVFNAKEEGAKQRLYEATYKVDFVNIDKPDDRASMLVSAHALDNGDKAPGKALSYATKNAMLKMFNIETGESDESRYQTEDFDLAGHIDAINNCESLDELKKQFTTSIRSAEEARDKDAQKSIIAAKETAKKKLTEAAK